MEEESLEHILWSCSFAMKAWSCIEDVFGIKMHQNLTTTYKAAKGMSRMIKDLWLLCILVVRSELWMMRNNFIYNNKQVSWIFFQKRVFNQVHDYSRRLKGFMHNNVKELSILNFFRVIHRKIKQIEPVECFWVPPEVDELMLCCDGASRDNPGVAGGGVVVRDTSYNVIGAMSIGLGTSTNYLAEFCGYCWDGMGYKI